MKPIPVILTNEGVPARSLLINLVSSDFLIGLRGKTELAHSNANGGALNANINDDRLSLSN